MTTTGRIRALDGLRGIAILLVIFWHYGGEQTFWGITESVPVAIIKTLHSIAWGGVDLFFVLSGLLIVGGLLDAPKDTRYFTSFYIRRACRILPLYLLMVFILIFVLQFHLSDNEFLFSNTFPIASYLTFTQNFLVQGKGWGAQWLGITWSLAIEEQFYLVVPLIVFLCNRTQLIWLFALCAASAPIFRANLGEIDAYVLPFARSDAILMGALLAIAIRNNHVTAWFETHAKTANLFFLTMLGVVACAALNSPKPGGWMIHLAMAVFFSAFVVIAIHSSKHPTFDSILSNSVLVWFGLRSYAIYLLHQGVFFVIDGFYSEIPPFQTRMLILAGALGTVLLLAELSYRVFEAPILAWGRRMTFEAKNDPPSMGDVIRRTRPKTD